MKKLLTTNSIDKKFSLILPKDVEYISCSFTELVVNAYRYRRWKKKSDEKAVIAIRYIRNEPILKIIFRLFTYKILSKIYGIKIVYFCHNIYHYSLSSRWMSKLVNKLLFSISDTVVPFADDQLQYLPKGKVLSYKLEYLPHLPIIKEGHTRTRSMIEEWAMQTDRILMLVSTMPLSADIINTLHGQNVSILLINPRGNFTKVITKSKCFIFDWYYGGLDFIACKKVIGLVLLNNHSIPTGYYNYLYLRFPIIAANDSSVVSEVDSNGIGEIFSELSDIDFLSQKIFKNYDYYRKNIELIGQGKGMNNQKIFSSIFS